MAESMWGLSSLDDAESGKPRSCRLACMYADRSASAGAGVGLGVATSGAGGGTGSVGAWIGGNGVDGTATFGTVMAGTRGAGFAGRVGADGGVSRNGCGVGAGGGLAASRTSKRSGSTVSSPGEKSFVRGIQ